MFNLPFTIREVAKVLLLQFLLVFSGYQSFAQDTDGDGTANATDTDDDNDGIPDSQEILLTNYRVNCGSVADFSGPSNLVSGTAKQQGAVYRIDNVLTGVDALVEVEVLQSITDLNIDDNASNPASFKPSSTISKLNLNEEAYTQYKITFVSPGGTTPVIVPSITANIADIDGNENAIADIVYVNGHSSISQEQAPTYASEITVYDQNAVWSKFTAGTSEATGSDTVAKGFAVSANFQNVSTIRLRLGIKARENINSATTRPQRIDFTCPLNYTNLSTIILDFDGDGIYNAYDLDSDNDGIGDGVESGITATNSNLIDTDQDSHFDFLDLDSDNDGITDIVEGQSTAAFKSILGTDQDKDGVDDAFDATAGFGANLIVPVNTDSTDAPDYLDADADNDKQPDLLEGWDTNNDEVANVVPSEQDIDNDGLDDAFDSLLTGVNPGSQKIDIFPNTSGSPEKDWRDRSVDKPTANKDVLEGTEDQTLALDNIFKNDVRSDDGPSPTDPVTITVAPAHGTITIKDNGTPAKEDDQYSYVPAVNYNGQDTLVYQVCDATGDCDTALVVIKINAVNDSPVLVGTRITINEDSEASGQLLSSADYDPDGTNLTTSTPVKNPSHGEIKFNPNGSYNYKPAANYSGYDTVIVKVCDNGLPLPASCGSDSLIFIIAPVNDAPQVKTVTGNTDPAVPEQIELKPNVSDPDAGSVLTYSIITAPQGSRAVVNPTTGVLTYTSTPDKTTRIDVVVFNVCDNSTPSLCTTGEVRIAIPDRSFRPRNDSVTINEDEVATVLPANNDTAFHKLDYSKLAVTVQPKHGKLSVNKTNNSFVYTPDLNYFGKDTVTYTICTAATPSECKTARVFYTISPVNDLEVNGDAYIAGLGNSGVRENFIKNDIDPENTGITAGNLIKGAMYGTFTFDPKGDFLYVPNENSLSSLDSVVVEVCDKGSPLPGICKPNTIKFTIKQYMFVSEGFTPNGDNENPNFVIETIIPGKVDLKVYNRWGNLVYANEDYKNNEWDGKANQGIRIGEVVPEGTYFYEVTFGNGEVKRSYLTIVK